MHCHSYIFFDSEPSLNSIFETELEIRKKLFIEVIHKHTNVRVFSFATLGFKARTRFMLWIQAGTAEEIQHLVRDLLHTQLGKHLRIEYSLFGLTRTSHYNSRPKEHQEEKELGDLPRKKYLIVYPFTKTKEWHVKEFEERKRIMIGHMKVGGKYGMIEQQLLYGYGVDDHEFILSYETDVLMDFQNLVMELRNHEGRLYTQNDLPVFTCIYGTLEETLKVL